jgi:hypothetical protein
MKPVKILLLVAAVWCGWNSALAQTWTQTSAPTNTWRTLASSADGTKVVAASAAIFTSMNSGISWLMTSAPSNVGGWFSVASSADGTKLVAAAIGLIYTSVDSGVTWVSNSVSTNEDWSSVASSSDGNKLAAVSSGHVSDLLFGGIYTSTNSGTTWTQQTNAPSKVWVCVVSSADGNKLVAINGQNSIYTSTNSGITWTQTGTPPVFWYSGAPCQIMASSEDGTRLVLGFLGISSGLSPIYISTNSGTTWTQTSAPSNYWTSVASSADGSKLMAAAGFYTPTGPILTSTNFGVTWTTNNVPFQNWAAVTMSADGNKLVGATGDYPSGPIYTSYSAPAPQLNITPSSSNLALSWTVPSTNFVMQQSSDLFVWKDLTNTPVLNLTNLQNEVVLPSPGGNAFYRLKTP